MRQGKLLSFGEGGHSIDFGSGWTLSGYDEPETFDGWDDVPEGCPVLDKRPAMDTKEGYWWVFRGPMVNVDLPEGEVDRLRISEDNPMIHAMLSGSGNLFGALAALHITSKEPVGPLDYVSTKDYIKGWVNLGAKEGVVKNRSIFWFN